MAQALQCKLQPLVKWLQLDRLDDHESLVFLHKNHKVHPSTLIATLLGVLTLLVLFFYMETVVSSILCFIFPLSFCLDKEAHFLADTDSLKQIEKKKKDIKVNDEEMSKLEAEIEDEDIKANRAKYMTYFIIFCLMEISLPVFYLFLAPVTLILVRAMLAILLLEKKINGAGVIANKIIKKVDQDRSQSLTQELTDTQKHMKLE